MLYIDFSLPLPSCFCIQRLIRYGSTSALGFLFILFSLFFMFSLCFGSFVDEVSEGGMFFLGSIYAKDESRAKKGSHHGWESSQYGRIDHRHNHHQDQKKSRIIQAQAESPARHWQNIQHSTARS